MHCFKRRHCEKLCCERTSQFTFVFTFSVVVVDLPAYCILSFLFPAETDVLFPVFSQSTDVVVVNSFVVLNKFPNMRATTSQYEIYLISGQNSHLPSQNVFLQSVIYSTKKTIILAWGKSRVFSTDPPFLHRRDNNDCRPLHGTWRTLCMNKHLINKAVGRTQKTSFPLSSISKASLCSDFKTNPSSCASKSTQSTSVISQRKL